MPEPRADRAKTSLPMSASKVPGTGLGAAVVGAVSASPAAPLGFTPAGFAPEIDLHTGAKVGVAAGTVAAATAGSGATIAPSTGGPNFLRGMRPVVTAPAAVGAGVPPIAPPAPARGRGGHRGGPLPLWRRVGFAFVVLALVASIPVLGYAGYRILSNSKDGTYTSTVTNPADPGFEAQVDPTPTAVVIQYDAQHEPVGTTFLSLSTSTGGGGVVFVPLDTEVAKPALGVNRLRSAYDSIKDRPILARDQLSTEVGKLFNVGIEEVAELDDGGWAQLVAPVAPFSIDNPEPVTLADGTTIPSGTTPLTKDQVGPYLAARKPGESDLARLNRSQAVWTAWLEKVKEAKSDSAVPGETTAGIGRFARSLAKGDISYQTLPVDHILDSSGRYRIQKDAVRDLVTELVPSPTPAAPGSRTTIRLLDGVSAGTIPLDLTKKIVHMDGTTTIIGNGPSFGVAKTSIVYADPAKKAIAQVYLKALGGTGSVRLDLDAPDTVDLTILLGKDILGDDPKASNTVTTAAGALGTSADPGVTTTTTPGFGTTAPGFTTTSGGT